MSKVTHRERRPRRPEVRDRLIAAAAEVLAERGFEASVEEISERAGFSRGAFYSNFDTKEELFLAALHVRMQVRIGELEDSLNDTREVWDILSRLGSGRRKKRSWSDFAGFTRFLYHALARRDLRAELAAMERERQRLFGEAASRLLHDVGSNPGDTDELGRVLSALDHGLTMQAYLQGKPTPVDFNRVVSALLPALMREPPVS